MKKKSPQVANVPKIVEKFNGKWDKLEAGLKKKFGDKAPEIIEPSERAARKAVGL